LIKINPSHSPSHGFEYPVLIQLGAIGCQSHRHVDIVMCIDANKSIKLVDRPVLGPIGQIPDQITILSSWFDPSAQSDRSHEKQQRISQV